MRKLDYRTDIQFLRGLAVLAVILFHGFENQFPLGYLGVDVFFVISGFVVTPLIFNLISLNEGRMNRLSKLKDFYLRRFWRLAPALSAMLSVSAVLVFLLGPLSDQDRFTRQGLATLLLIGNIGAYKYAGSYFSPNPNPLIHTWSLSVEEQFYLLIPFLIVLLIWNQSRLTRYFKIFFFTLTSLSTICFLYPSYLQSIYLGLGFNRATEFSFYSPAERMWQFGAGGLSFLFVQQKSAGFKQFKKTSRFLCVLALVLILFSRLQISTQVGSVIATLIAIAAITTKSLFLLPRQICIFLKWVGDRSYSIYLIHMPLIYVSKYSPFLNLGLDRNRTIQTIIALILTFILGHLSFDFIETRFKFSETKDKTRINLRTISKNIAFLILLPTSLFVAMTYANTNGYWGLNRNIQPPIAAWDLDPECRRMSHQDSPCLYSTNNSKGTILLIGDSQAAQFSQAVIDAARNQGYDTAVWTQGLCYVQFDREFLNQVTNECLAQNHQIFNWSVRNKPVSIVVAEQVRADASLKDLIGGLSKMKSSSNNVLLIENIPKFADSADFMIARPIFMKPYNPPKTFPLSKMETYNIAASKSLAAQAKKIGIKTINFSSIFCDNKYCRRYSGNRWLYHDTGHLSEEGAKLTIPEFESYFRTF